MGARDNPLGPWDAGGPGSKQPGSFRIVLRASATLDQLKLPVDSAGSRRAFCPPFPRDVAGPRSRRPTSGKGQLSRDSGVAQIGRTRITTSHPNRVQAKVRDSLTEDFRSFLETRDEWFDYIADYRHALGHRAGRTMLGWRVIRASKIEVAMKRIAALAAATAVISTLTAITQVTAQQLGCADDKKRAQAQACIRDCGKRFPKPEPDDRAKRQACQDVCIAACRFI
jgi:hypothetical protein